MFKRLAEKINSRLWIKLMVPVTLIVILAIGSSLWFNIRFQDRQGMDQMRTQNRLLSQTVEGAMFDALAVGDNDTVRTQFRRLSEKIGDMKIFVYDFRSEVTFSTDVSAVGKPMSGFLNGSAQKQVSGMLESGDVLEEISDLTLGTIDFTVIHQPIMNEPRCYHCHGRSQKVLGGISVFSPVTAMKKSMDRQRLVSIFIGVLGLFAIIAFILLFFHFMVGKKVRMVLQATASLREKDFTRDYQVKQGDELNYILARIDLVTKELRQTMTRVKEGSDTIYDSASQLKTISGDLSRSSSQASEKAVTVSAGAEQLSTNNRSIASAMEESAHAMDGIAVAVDQMSSTVGEIAKNAAESREIIVKVNTEFTDMLSMAGKLGDRAADVDGVTDEIRSIADQVSMLALNARIEAARAGEAGKGFAVVAQEITELAVETGKSTIQADEKLQWIKESSGKLVEQLSGLTGVIQDSDSAIASIAAAVEEQNVATREIAANINDVTARITQVNENVNQGAKAASDIAQDIGQVEEGAAEVRDSSGKVDENASQLSAMAENFKAMISEFKI